MYSDSLTKISYFAAYYLEARQIEERSENRCILSVGGCLHPRWDTKRLGSALLLRQPDEYIRICEPRFAAHALHCTTLCVTLQPESQYCVSGVKISWHTPVPLHFTGICFLTTTTSIRLPSEDQQNNCSWEVTLDTLPLQLMTSSLPGFGVMS